MQRLDMALKRLGIKMLGVMSDALATPEAVLLPDEKEEGVAVVDVGGGVTDVTVYYRNVVRYVASIPMGASAINRDIRTMSVPEKHVESLKQKYGSAVAEVAPEDKLIRVNGRTAREAKDILLRNLATVIEARATDIAEFVQQEIKDFGIRRETGLRHRADGRFGQIEGPRRTVPPRDGHGRACRCARDGNHRGVEGEGCGRRFLDRRGHPAQGGRTGRLRRHRASRGSASQLLRSFTPPRPAAGGFKAPQQPAAPPYTPPVSASEPDSGVPAGAESAGRTDEESAAEPPMVEPKRTRTGCDLPEDLRQDQQEFHGRRGRGDLG